MSVSIETISCDVLIIGAGVTGLAVAAELPPGKNAILIERRERFGQETSSRNSEVVHSGIHYPIDSCKTKWCIEGRRRLYAFCEKRGVPFRQTGKLVVATEPQERAYLDRLAAHCQQLQVPYQRLGGREVSEKEPLVAAEEGLFFPESGIVDSHAFMAALERQAREKLTFAYSHLVRGIRRDGGEWYTVVETPQAMVTVRSQCVVNAAGLAAAELSNLALQTDEYQHRFCRGAYLCLPGSYRDRFKHLVYPVPQKDGLGVHITIDMAGQARLGPDVEWCTAGQYADLESLYEVDWDARRRSFAAAAHRYLPQLSPEYLSPGLVGVRPKFFRRGVAHPDFLVENRDGFIHCLGVESPGLTASLALARAVVALL